MKKTDKKSRKLLNLGLEMSGAVSGSAFSLLMDPTGGLMSSALGVVVTSGLKEVSARFLSNREERRIGYSAVLAVSNIENRLKQGDKLRADNFFENRIYNRSKAEELFEGVLLKCKTEYEEKKLSI